MFGAIDTAKMGKCCEEEAMSRRKLLFDPEMPLSQLMLDLPETVAVFERYGMLCVGCLVGPFHNLSDACLEHEVDEDEFAAALDAAISLARAPR
jgi:hybrid cluster-associated redox disulfide protein